MALNMRFQAKTKTYRDSEFKYVLTSDADMDLSARPNRCGDQSPPPFRGQRLYSSNGQWFFDTREREQFGPYRDQGEAKKALAIFVAHKLHGRIADGPTNIPFRPGAQDGIAYMVEELLGFVSSRNDRGQTAALAWAHRRLKEVSDYSNHIPNAEERMKALEYAMNQE